jgi:hypothetical protein
MLATHLRILRLPIIGVTIMYKNNHNTSDCRAIAKFKQQKKAHFEAEYGSGKKSLAFLFEEMNGQLKPEMTASNKKRHIC